MLNHWTQIQSPSEAESGATSSSDDKSNQPVVVLRPIWQRVMLAGTYVTAGLIAATIFLGHRARHIHSMHIVPTSQLAAPQTPAKVGGKARTLFLQTCGNRPSQGYLVPINQCKLKESWIKSKPIVSLKVDGVPESFNVGIEGSTWNGRYISSHRVFEHLVQCGIPRNTVHSKKRL